MKPNDLIQWFCLALIAAGCFLIWVPLGLIVAGILGIVGTTVNELQTAMLRARAQRAERQRREG